MKIEFIIAFKKSKDSSLSFSTLSDDNREDSHSAYFYLPFPLN